jgi:hypothetical protein
MIKFAFSDGEDICVYDGEKVNKYTSRFIENYKQNARDIVRSKQWKTAGEGAKFREVGRMDESDLNFNSNISGVFLTDDPNTLVYTFSINDTNGIYKKHLNDEKNEESHVVNSVEYIFLGGSLNAQNGALAMAIKHNYYISDIAILDIDSGDYKSITCGDTLDEDPYICPDDANIIYYSSRGVGRDAQGNFVEYSPSALYKLNINDVQVEEVKSSKTHSYFRPVYHGGKLYAIKAPIKQSSGNALIEIILIPIRIIQAIVGFVNAFVKVFAGKSLTSGGDNPAKGREYDSRKIAIAGNIIDVEKQQKKNASKKNVDYGFVPNSWQLVEVDSGAVIKSGVADFDICEDGTFIVTNGRRIFAIKDGKETKLCNTQFCIRVNAMHSCKNSRKNQSDGGDFFF